ncbi:MAG: DUF5034 domain-containing protein [Bacteroidales bacterium]
MYNSTVFAKTTIIIIFFFFLKIFFSCTPPDPIDMTYSVINLEVMDNSGHYHDRNYSDTLYSDAVSIQLSLSDSSTYYASNSFKSGELFSFESACAWSPNYSYKPVHLIQDIRVYTEFDLDDTYKAGANISDSILFSLESVYSLYETIDKAIMYFNDLQWEPSCTVRMYLKSSVKNSQAQFIVEVLLDDGSKLIETTDVFYITPSNL